MNRPQDYIKFTTEGINYGYTLFYLQESDGGYSFYIPAYKINFSASSIEDGDKRAEAMLMSFYNYWTQKGKTAFTSKIIKLGFLPENKEDYQPLLEKGRSESALTAMPHEIPGSFAIAENKRQENKFALS